MKEFKPLCQYSLKELFECAKKSAPYYSNLYKDTDYKTIESLPIVNQAEFWKSSPLTSEPHGIVFKSGGSTGSPKYSYFTHNEWETYTQAFGKGLARNMIKDHDRVANLFYGGDLYASFFFIKDALKYANEDVSITHFPIAGQTKVENVLATLNEFRINVIFGVPSAIVILLEEYQKNKKNYPDILIERIFYGGEAMYEDQIKAIKNVFSNIEITSIGCATVDGGMIGYSTLDCEIGEHRVLENVGIIEIVDPDTLEVIKETNRAGKVLLTNLTRKLMPILRYPSGDMAMWMEEEGVPNRKFKLLGRSDEAARLGTLSVYFEDTRKYLIEEIGLEQGIQFQMILKHYDQKDELTLVVGLDRLETKELEEKIMKRFIKEKKGYQELLDLNLIHKLKIEIKKISDLELNSRTGKFKRIIDQRGRE